MNSHTLVFFFSLLHQHIFDTLTMAIHHEDPDREQTANFQLACGAEAPPNVPPPQSVPSFPPPPPPETTEDDEVIVLH
ncbi:hypothetical protein BX667DRAFT_504505 [Coemansia mojavensis]|nr:hypothetical protein BX667DRAFT_504505 [Coemansia mojavensis]